jgi:hypothetical protein
MHTLILHNLCNIKGNVIILSLFLISTVYCNDIIFNGINFILFTVYFVFCNFLFSVAMNLNTYLLETIMIYVQLKVAKLARVLNNKATMNISCQFIFSLFMKDMKSSWTCFRTLKVTDWKKFYKFMKQWWEINFTLFFIRIYV